MCAGQGLKRLNVRQSSCATLWTTNQCYVKNMQIVFLSMATGFVCFSILFLVLLRCRSGLPRLMFPSLPPARRSWRTFGWGPSGRCQIVTELAANWRLKPPRRLRGVPWPNLCPSDVCRQIGSNWNSCAPGKCKQTSRAMYF